MHGKLSWQAGKKKRKKKNPSQKQPGFYFHSQNRLHNVRAYKTPKLFLFGQFLLKQLYHKSDCKPWISNFAATATFMYWERLVCEQKCIIHFLSYLLWERYPECSPLFCKDWMLHQEHCHQKWAFLGISWEHFTEGQVTFAFRVRKQIYTLICC